MSHEKNKFEWCLRKAEKEIKEKAQGINQSCYR